MMDLKEQFEQAAAASKTLPEKPSNEVLLRLYSLYKQATLGDNETSPPDNPFDIVGKAKFEAWSSLKGMAGEAAMQEYVDLVQTLRAG